VTDLLTDFLDIETTKKSSLSMEMLSLNFVHPPSLLSWLEMRRMTFDVGKRFMRRVEYTLACFLILCFSIFGFYISERMGWIYMQNYNEVHRLILLVWVMCIAMYAIPALIVATLSN
jgi:predicted GNAT superfamily acetyltransferase